MTNEKNSKRWIFKENTIILLLFASCIKPISLHLIYLLTAKIQSTSISIVSLVHHTSELLLLLLMLLLLWQPLLWECWQWGWCRWWRRRALHEELDNCSCTNIMWSPSFMASSNGARPVRKSFTCNHRNWGHEI